MTIYIYMNKFREFRYMFDIYMYIDRLHLSIRPGGFGKLARFDLKIRWPAKTLRSAASPLASPWVWWDIAATKCLDNPDPCGVKNFDLEIFCSMLKWWNLRHDCHWFNTQPQFPRFWQQLLWGHCFGRRIIFYPVSRKLHLQSNFKGVPEQKIFQHISTYFNPNWRTVSAFAGHLQDPAEKVGAKPIVHNFVDKTCCPLPNGAPVKVIIFRVVVWRPTWRNWKQNFGEYMRGQFLVPSAGLVVSNPYGSFWYFGGLQGVGFWLVIEIDRPPWP